MGLRFGSAFRHPNICGGQPSTQDLLAHAVFRVIPNSEVKRALMCWPPCLPLLPEGHCKKLAPVWDDLAETLGVSFDFGARCKEFRRKIPFSSSCVVYHSWRNHISAPKVGVATQFINSRSLLFSIDIKLYFPTVQLPCCDPRVAIFYFLFSLQRSAAPRFFLFARVGLSRLIRVWYPGSVFMCVHTLPCACAFLLFPP